MPRTVFSIKAAIRDHTISIPSPENTARYAIPNACGACHADRDAKWATAKLDDWYGPAVDSASRRGKLLLRAAAFSDARMGSRQAIGPLMAIISNVSSGPLARANAVGSLSSFGDDPRVLPALAQALKDPEPLVRAVAALRIESKTAPAVVREALVHALGDPVRTVRASAVLSLVSLGVPRLSPENARMFESAKQEYLARAAIYADDATEQFTKGGFLLLSGDPAAAASALRTSLQLDPSAPSRYLLAVACLQLNQRDEAMRVLHSIPQSDRYFATAQTLIGTLQR
jgi:HEAT repeat protein